MKRFLAGFFLMGCCYNSFSQANQCEETLNAATEQFNEGHFYDIPDLLKPCIDKNDFTREQRVRVYLLLSQVYLITDDPESAEDAYLKLLQADPEYIATKEKDPIDVVYLSKKFTSTPIITPHVGLGMNTSFFRGLEHNPADRQTANPEPTPLKHGLRIGFHFGGGFDWNINNNWSLCVEGLLSSRGFKVTDTHINTQTSAIPDNLAFAENLTFFDLPLYLKYSDDKGQVRPFGYTGIAGNFLLDAKDKYNLGNNTQTSTQSLQSPDINVKYIRRTFSKSFVIGGGVKYKIGKDFIYADVRLMIGLSNMIKGNVFAPQNQDPQISIYHQENGVGPNTYGAVSPLYSLDNLSISFGYVRPLYNPRKIRKPNMKSILRVFDKKVK